MRRKRPRRILAAVVGWRISLVVRTISLLRFFGNSVLRPSLQGLNRSFKLRFGATPREVRATNRA